LCATTSCACRHSVSSASTTTSDGQYAVLPWDTYPEFGKMKPVDSCTMSLRDGHGEIKIAYEDDTSYSIDVQVGSTNGDLWFSYSFPGYENRGQIGIRTVPLRKAGEFLEMLYLRRWVRFAQKIHAGERTDYPRWGELTEDAWGKPSPMIDESE